MKTVDVRLLVPDEVDPGELVAHLVLLTGGPGAPLGAALLVGDRYGRLVPHAEVWIREGLAWDGQRYRSGGRVAGRGRSKEVRNVSRRVTSLGRAALPRERT